MSKSIFRHIKLPVHLAGAELDLVADDKSNAVCLLNPWQHASDTDAQAAELIRVINNVDELVEVATEVQERLVPEFVYDSLAHTASLRLAAALTSMRPAKSSGGTTKGSDNEQAE